MNEQLKKWRTAGTPVKIRASVTLPFDTCFIRDHDQLGVTVESNGEKYCVPFSAITSIGKGTTDVC